MREFTRDERSMLLYMEARCTDHSGLLIGEQMNKEDLAIGKKWDEEGYVKFGRLRMKHIQGNMTYACRLSDEAWADAARLRRERADKAGPLADEKLCGDRDPHPIDTTVKYVAEV